MTNWGSALRRELAQRAKRFAVAHNITHYESCGFPPTILFPSDPANLRHGNFIDDSYAAILENPTWAKRLEKAHPRHDALPEDRRDDARELDSSNSSDALLMNCFCYPGAATRIFQSFLPSLPTGPSELLEFGVAGKVPLLNGKCDKTELDMRAGTVVFESKLTESHFYEASAGKLERYRDLYTVFDITALPRTDDTYQGYQLIRNILAAAVHDYHFVLLCDDRRPDLLRHWQQVRGAIRAADLRVRSHLLLWQQVVDACPSALQNFLREKYGL